MTPAEIEALVEQIGEEILGRLGLPASALNGIAPPRLASAEAWSRPKGGYASAVEWVFAAPEASAAEVCEACVRAGAARLPVVWTPISLTAHAVAALGGSPTRAGALVDFPFGAASTAARLADVETALRLGADVVNLTLGGGRARSLDADVLKAEVRAAAGLCSGAALAVTLEAELLTDEELARAASASLEGGADALCTGTGACGRAFASDRAVAILRGATGAKGVVIAGGRIAGFPHAAALIAAGADRIAVEDSLALLAGAPSA
jgi:deoxyribose-phosphate aldolase